MIRLFAFLFPLFLFLPPASQASAQDRSGEALNRLHEFRQLQAQRADGKARAKSRPENMQTDSYEGRDFLIHVPKEKSAAAPILIVLHGGMGNAAHIHSVLRLDRVAEEKGFILAYLNGTKVAERLGDNHHAWNGGGGCCGKAYRNNVDDTGYIAGAVAFIAKKYNGDMTRAYVTGHSNGGIMAQRMMCETDVFRAAVPISGPLNLSNPECRNGAGRKILAIHGSEDKNVPIGGGYGTRGVTNIAFQSQQSSKAAFEAVGTEYTILTLTGVDHALVNIVKAIEAREGTSFGHYLTTFFGL